MLVHYCKIKTHFLVKIITLHSYRLYWANLTNTVLTEFIDQPPYLPLASEQWSVGTRSERINRDQKKKYKQRSQLNLRLWNAPSQALPTLAHRRKLNHSAETADIGSSHETETNSPSLFSLLNNHVTDKAELRKL